MNEYCTIGEIKTYSVLRYTKYGTCDISLTPDDYEGKTKEIGRGGGIIFKI